MNGLADSSVSTIGKPHEYFDLTGILRLIRERTHAAESDVDFEVAIKNENRD